MTRRLTADALVIAVLLARSVSVSAQTQDAKAVEFLLVSTANAADRARAEEVMRVDEEFRRAKLANDLKTLDRIVSDDYFGTNQTGRNRNKRELLELFESFRIESLTTDRASVRFSGNIAIVTGEQTEKSGTGHDRMLFTRIYARGSAGWQLLSSTQFRHPDTTVLTGR